MLGKLISYEIRGLWKPALIILAVMVAAGVVGMASLFGFNAISYDSAYLSDARATQSASLFMLAVFAGFILMAGPLALTILVIVRFYRTMFTDEGYLTLTLPVSTAKLVLAKFFVGFAVSFIGIFLALMLGSAMLSPLIEEPWTDCLGMILAASGGDLAASLYEGLPASSVALGVVNIFVSVGYGLALAYLSFTLGAWWAKRHKVAAAIAIYFGISWLVSLLFSIVNVFSMLNNAYPYEHFAQFGAIMEIQMVCYAVLAVAAVALTIFLVRRKVDLS